MEKRPNILLIMCDQLRYDCVAALGNRDVLTPNLDRLARRGLIFDQAYSTCPVCVPARYTLRTGQEPRLTGCYQNESPQPMDNLPQDIEARCGKYLARAMGDMGYYTFGIGKFHTMPAFREDLGYHLQLNTEEMWEDEAQRQQDAFAQFIRQNHPEYAHLQQLHGERTNMYYMPQTSPLPAHLTVEAFVADQAVEQIQCRRDRPYFGFVSFIGPHPPFAPPIPFNYLYDPDKMPNPVVGDLATDHMDEQIPWMNHVIWADELNDFMARTARSRYYGEITYIDQCVGRILDAVEERGDGEDTLICFCADHGDHLGDHHAWQKESFFEQSCRIPFLLSYPRRLPQGRRNGELVCLTDVFGIVTGAAGREQVRGGYSVLGMLEGREAPRRRLFACYGRPGTPQFKTMIRQGPWKYIFLANGGREQLFNLEEDPQELSQVSDGHPQVMEEMRRILAWELNRDGLRQALEEGRPRTFPFTPRPLQRIYQFDHSSGVMNFTQNCPQPKP